MKKSFNDLKYDKYYKELAPFLKKDKNQQYLTAILTLCASIFFILFAINPTLSTIAKLRKEISDSRIVEEKLSEKVNSLSSLSQEYSDIEESLPFILDAIPQKPEAPLLIAQIQAIAKNDSVEIITLDISPVSLGGSTSTTSSSFAFKLSGYSTYENLEKFISDLINMQRAVAIDSITVGKVAELKENLQLDIKGKVYFKK